MPVFAIHCMASKLTPDRQIVRGLLSIVDASNHDEAIGMSARMALRVFPTSRGWYSHVMTAAEASPDKVEDIDVFPACTD